MTFKELTLLQKYFFNRVDLALFTKALRPISTDNGYINEKYELFTKNQVSFITNYDPIVFEFFMNEIKNTKYSG